MADATRAKILPPIADHKLMNVLIHIPCPKPNETKRLIWKFAETDWQGLRRYIQDIKWEAIVDDDASIATEKVISASMGAARLYIACKHTTITTPPHP